MTFDYHAINPFDWHRHTQVWVSQADKLPRWHHRKPAVVAANLLTMGTGVIAAIAETAKLVLQGCGLCINYLLEGSNRLFKAGFIDAACQKLPHSNDCLTTALRIQEHVMDIFNASANIVFELTGQNAAADSLETLGRNLDNILEAVTCKTPTVRGSTTQHELPGLYTDWIGPNGCYPKVNLYAHPFHVCIPPFGASEIEQKRIKDVQAALGHTRKIWEAILSEFNPLQHFTIITNYLNNIRSGNESEVHQDKADISKQFIIDYYNQTCRFMEAAKSDTNLQVIIKQYFPDCNAHWEWIELYHDIGSYESWMNERVPVKLIEMMALMTAEIKPETSQQAELWAIKLIEKKIPARILFRCISATVKYLNQNALSGQQYDLSNALEAVEKGFSRRWAAAPLDSPIKESNLLVQEDSVHLAWRDSLKKGDVLRSKEYVRCADGSMQYILHEFTLGESVGKKEAGEPDRSINFKLASYRKITCDSAEHTLEEFFCRPDILNDSRYKVEMKDDSEGKLVWIGINQAVTFIKYRWWERDREGGEVSELNLQQFRHQGPYLLDFKQIDPEGRFAITEELDPLYSSDWKDNETHHAMIVVWLNHLCNGSLIPNILNTKYLMLEKLPANNDCKIMKFIKTNPPAPFDLKEVETHIYEIASHDVKIYQRYLEESGLRNHLHARFIRQAAMKTFEDFEPGDKINEDQWKEFNEAQWKETKKPVIESAKEIQLKIRMKFEDCLRAIESHKNKRLTEPEKSDLKEYLLDYYSKSGGALVLLPNFEQDVINHFIKGQ